MSRQAPTMESLPQAFEVVKEMQTNWTGAKAVARTAARRWPSGGPLARRPRWQRPARPALSVEQAQRATHPARLPDLEVLKSCARRAPVRSRRSVLVALDGTKESVDVQRERRPVGALPHRAAPPRASPARASEMIGVDGGQGLITALPIVCHTIPVQRGGAHTIRTILNEGPQGWPPCRHECRRTPLRRHLGRYLPQGRRLPAQRSRRPAPPAYAKTLAGQKLVRTTNAIERRFREVRRRTRPMGTFQDRTSMDRILMRRLHSPKQVSGNQCPNPGDT